MEKDQEKNTPKKNLNSEYIPPKKKIITSYDKNNEAYYSELNSREQTLQQSNDYYELLKQQIKYYKELNSSLRDEIETVKQCKNLKEQKKNRVNPCSQFDKNELKLNELQKEPNLNLIDTLNQNLEKDKDKEIFLTESKNSNSEEQWVIVKKEMKRLEDENEFLKSSVEKLNDTIKNMKYPDEENNSYINNNNISISINNNKEEQEEINNNNNNDINFQNKLLLDNKRLQIYIEKIQQMQDLLIRYESQINSLNDGLKQKDDKIKGLIIKLKSPNKDDKNEILNEDDIVNIKLNNDNINNNINDEVENGNNELNNQLKQLNEIMKENEKLKNENEKLNEELNKINNNKENDNKDKNEKLINELKKKNIE